jgi:hypothetical protein
LRLTSKAADQILWRRCRLAVACFLGLVGREALVDLLLGTGRVLQCRLAGGGVLGVRRPGT